MTTYDYCIAGFKLLVFVELWRFTYLHAIVLAVMSCFCVALIAIVDLIVGASLPVFLTTLLLVAIACVVAVTGKFPTPGL